MLRWLLTHPWTVGWLGFIFYVELLLKVYG